MANKVYNIDTVRTRKRRPQNFTSAEQVIEDLAIKIHMSGLTYRVIAEGSGV